MRLLALLHRWAGGIAGLLLALIGLSGTALVWEEYWIGLPGADAPLRADPAALGAAVEAALALDPALSRITFADEGMGMHQAIFQGGGGAYLTQGAEVVDRWDSLWGRPELWLFDLHHYLFLGETGKTLTGVLGLLLIAFTATGAILWWRTRRTFRFRLWPARLTRSAIVRQHRDLGVVASPLLLLAAVTGTMMVFPALSEALLSPWASAAPAQILPSAAAEQRGRIELQPTGRPGNGADWRVLMANAQAAFPDAAARRLTLPAAPGEPATLRLRQGFEWTPNGRTYVYLDLASARVLATDDPAAGDTAAKITEKFYPIHAGKVGGLLWHGLLTFAGLTLALLGTLATWSFWFAPSTRPAARAVPAGALEPAE